MKFGRLYTMTVQGRTLDFQGNPTLHYISFPLTCRFQIVKSSTLSMGSAVFRIYNLTAEVRSDLYKDTFEQLIRRTITFAAGYEGEQLPKIFQGNVLQSWSYREGPDWVTEIQALDGGDAVDNAIANVTKPFPYGRLDLALDVIGQMKNYGISVGSIGDLSESVLPPIRGITMNGNAWDLINRILKPKGGFAFINNEQVHIVNQWEYIQNVGGLEVIDAAAGMIGTPILQSNLVKVRMIYEPRLEIQQSVLLNTVESRMTGNYVVLRLIHRGTISGAVCEDLITEATIYQPDRTPVEVPFQPPNLLKVA